MHEKVLKPTKMLYKYPKKNGLKNENIKKILL